MTVMSSVDVPAMKKSLKGGSSKQKKQNKAPNCVIIFFFSKKVPRQQGEGREVKTLEMFLLSKQIIPGEKDWAYLINLLVLLTSDLYFVSYFFMLAFISLFSKILRCIFQNIC